MITLSAARHIALALGMSCMLVPHLCAAADALPVVGAKPVQFADNLNNGDRIGKIRILGLLQLPSFSVNNLRFAEFSDLAWDDDNEILYAQSDQGGLLWLRPVFTNSYLTDVKLIKALPLRELGNGKAVRWTRTDAEGMDVINGRNGRKNDTELVISFEREQRILRYRTDGTAISQYALPKPLDNIKSFSGANKSLEAVCMHPDHGVLTVPEQPLSGERPGYTRIFDLNGKSWYYPVTKNSGIVAMQCNAGGDILVVERDYLSIMVHTIISLKKIHLPAGLADGATLSAETLVRLDDNNGLRLDNFEGLTRHRGNRYFMISDNNDNFLQRTLLLYFEIVDGK
jgi:hypothetical protein